MTLETLLHLANKLNTSQNSTLGQMLRHHSQKYKFTAQILISLTLTIPKMGKTLRFNAKLFLSKTPFQTIFMAKKSSSTKSLPNNLYMTLAFATQSKQIHQL